MAPAPVDETPDQQRALRHTRALSSVAHLLPELLKPAVGCSRVRDQVLVRLPSPSDKLPNDNAVAVYIYMLALCHFQQDLRADKEGADKVVCRNVNTLLATGWIYSMANSSAQQG